MGNVLPNTAWDHLYTILQLILSTMKAHTVSESGIHNPMTKLFNISNAMPYKDISIPFKALNLVLNFKGEIWRSNHQILISIPSAEWIRYGKGKMDLITTHHFQQVAWIQVSQFNASDLAGALQQVTTFDEISEENRSWIKYQETFQTRINYLGLLFNTKVYLLMEEWISKEKMNPNFLDYFTKLMLTQLVQEEVDKEFGRNNSNTDFVGNNNSPKWDSDSVKSLN